jgi:hypothetical protein
MQCLSPTLTFWAYESDDVEPASSIMLFNLESHSQLRTRLSPMKT